MVVHGGTNIYLDENGVSPYLVADKQGKSFQDDLNKTAGFFMSVKFLIRAVTSLQSFVCSKVIYLLIVITFLNLKHILCELFYKEKFIGCTLKKN